MAITTEMRTQVTQMYVALFGRAPEADGLGYWVDQMGNKGVSLESIANTMYATAPARAFYPQFLTNTEIIGKFYTNVLGRTADAGGLAFWTAKLNASGASVGSVISAMITNVATYSGTDAVGLDSAALFNNKVAVGLYYAVDKQGNSTTNTALNGVTKDAASVTAAKAAVDSVSYTGKTIALTKNVDTGADFTGGLGNDTFTGTLQATDPTWSALDAIDGGAGEDTLNVQALIDVVVPSGVTVSNIEKVAITAAGKVGTFTADNAGDIDLSTVFSGVKTLSVSGATQVDFKAPTSAAVTVTNATAGVEVVGGASQTVSLAAQGGNVAVTGSTGAVSLTSTAHGNNTIAANGGSTVNVATTSNQAAVGNTVGTITVGATTAATGAVAVTKTVATAGAAAMAGGNVTITKAGSTANVTVNATSTATVETSASALTLGAIAVTGGGATTAVTVAQNATATTFTKAAVAVVKETSTVTFKAMASGETLIVNGLTFTAAKALTANEVAGAFANFTAADTQSATGPTANGIYSGTFNTAVWTSGAASGATVLFTASDENQADLAFTGTATTNNAGAFAPTQAKVTGTAAAAAVTSTNSITLGAVTVDDAATATITDVTLNGYASADLGVVGNDLNALKKLSLANSAGTASIATSATSLDVTLNKVKNAVDISTKSAAVDTLNVTTTGADSAFALTAAQLKNLTVAGDKALTLTGTTTALESVTVTGTASLDISGVSANASKSINTTGTTGKVTASIDASAATYTGGAGVDSVTLTAAAISKAVDLGAGDDTLKLAAAATTVPTGAPKGGDGTDTISMDITSATSYDDNTNFAAAISGFERLTINGVVGSDNDTLNTTTVDLANLGFTSYVTTSGTVADTTTPAKSDVLVLDKLASGGTVALGAKGLITVQVANAATGTADVLNVVSNVTATNVDFGTVTAANVETVNVSASDVLADDNADGTVTTAEAPVEKATLVLTAANATTVNVSGSAAVDLTLTGSTAVTLVDGSTLTGALTVTSLNTTTATTIKGGSGNDSLTSASTSTAADKLMGGAGNDTLTANKGLSELTGGTGADTFQISVASANVNSAAAIMDVGSGDVIKFAGATAFKQGKVTLDPAGNPNLVSYADAAIDAIGTNEMAWFQYNGNTYVVQEKSGADSNSTFVNGTDFIVKIVGLVDLGTGASYNSTSNTLEIA